MNIVRFIEPVTCSFKKSAGGLTTVFEAGRDYVIATQQLDRICQDENVKARLYKVSRLEPRMVPFNISARKPGSQRLLFYNGSGGYGDQILSWPVAKWLSAQGFEVHVLSDPGNQCCWYSFPWVKTIEVAPIPYERFKLYDYHFLMEHVNNLDEHQDQLHPVDAMFTRMGVDPKSIDASLKAVEPVYTWLEQQTPRNVFLDKRYIGIFQLTSANSNRAMLPNDTAFALYKLAEATPDIHWLAIYDEFNPKTYVDALVCRECKGAKTVPVEAPPGVQPSVVDGVVVGFTGTAAPGADPAMGLPVAMAAAAQASVVKTCPECGGTGQLRPNIQPYMSPNLRDLWALAKFRATAVVSPDSLMVHVAGCQGVPCVGLWGPVAPGNRVAYYRNHHAIFHRETCPHAPCFTYLADFPKYCPPRGAKRTICEVMAAVTPQEIIDAVKKIRR
jgi:hypothetical protein